MKLVFAPDSFKGTLSSLTICRLLTDAARRVFPDAETVSVPVADGGEGSVDCFLAALGGEKIHAEVSGPYGERISSFYGLLPDGTAVVESAAAAGLPMVEGRKNPSETTTFGVGELMLAAAERGCRRILCCLGGICTNDGGCGAAAACGIRFLDADEKEFVPTGGTLSRISRVDSSGYKLKGVEIVTVCDVDNPLCGENGAAFTFAPQKGADREMCGMLDEGLRHMGEIIRNDLGIDLFSLSGAGAAGGMGGGTAAFFHARLKPGIEVVLDTARFDRLCQGADLVITGEGRFDAQSLHGKVPVGVAARATKARVPCIALVGKIGCELSEAQRVGISDLICINPTDAPFEVLCQQAEKNLTGTALALFGRLKRSSDAL